MEIAMDFNNDGAGDGVFTERVSLTLVIFNAN